MLISKYDEEEAKINVKMRAVVLIPSNKLRKAVVTMPIDSANKMETPLELKSI
tara:strand:+ start:478852 stop:479010 length:159 start_codon:yes stop_codon:yes gene_type:complete